MSTPTVTVVFSNAAVPNPNAGAAATTPLTPKQAEVVMQNVVVSALEIAAADAAYLVRIGWQTQGQPASKITEDVVYIRAVEEDDPYNKIRDEDMEPNTADESGETLLSNIIYTRIWRVFWTLYGPNSFDNARIIKSALIKPTQDIHDLLVAAHLYVVPDIGATHRVPEQRDEQWWERADFECLFNEAVVETETVNTVESVAVTVEAQGSQISTPAGYDIGGYDEGGFDSNS